MNIGNLFKISLSRINLITEKRPKSKGFVNGLPSQGAYDGYETSVSDRESNMKGEVENTDKKPKLDYLRAFKII